MTIKDYKDKIFDLPSQPGIYKYFNKKKTLIYVGKAKNIRKRVASYFTKTIQDRKTKRLVASISYIEFVLVNSEQDAYFLENSLIKQYQPKFNIDLKDNKTYPYLVVRNERFPRVYFTRRIIEDGSEYLGPFTSVKNVRQMLYWMKQSIPLRTCNLNLTEENIQKKKYKVCLEYHLGNCKGPCEGKQTLEDYMNGIQEIRTIFKGKLGIVIQQYKTKMAEHIERMEYEKAEELKKKIAHLQNYFTSKSDIISYQNINANVFSVIKHQSEAFLNHLRVEEGTIVEAETIEMQLAKDLEEKEILQQGIFQFQKKYDLQFRELILPFEIEIFPNQNIIYTIPKGGEKLKMLQLSFKNVEFYKKQKQHKENLENLRNNTFQQEALEELKNVLKLPTIPDYMECFDNSNMQGTNPVSAMVCFINGLPYKNYYRIFNVKTVVGINDFATMKEVVYRRYHRLKAENKAFPKLIIVDGGKGQLSSSVEALEALDLYVTIPIIGIAKNEEEIFTPSDTQSIKLPMDSPALKLIRQMRDEVHRFGINFHRKKRSKGMLTNEMEQIKGISKDSATLLLKKFKTVEQIKNQSLDELSKVLDKRRAVIVKNYFQEKATSTP